MSWHMKPEKGFTRPLDLAFVALPQSPLSKQQQQPLHRNSTETKGLLVSSRLKTFQMKKNARRRAPGGSRNRWIYSTCGSPTISPVDATAANSASKLNKSKGTSGLVSYLPKSIAWLHDCMTPFWDIRTRKDILGCKRRIALCILCSVFKHPLSPDHVCTCNWGPNGVGWHKLVFLQLSRRKSMRHGPAHDQHCKYMQHFRFVGESMLLFESISWGGTSNRRKGLQQIQSSLQETQTIWSNSKDFWKWPPHLHHFSQLPLWCWNSRCQNESAIKTLSISKITCQMRKDTSHVSLRTTS